MKAFSLTKSSLISLAILAIFSSGLLASVLASQEAQVILDSEQLVVDKDTDVSLKELFPNSAPGCDSAEFFCVETFTFQVERETVRRSIHTMSTEEYVSLVVPLAQSYLESLDDGLSVIQGLAVAPEHVKRVLQEAVRRRELLRFLGDDLSDPIPTGDVVQSPIYIGPLTKVSFYMLAMLKDINPDDPRGFNKFLRESIDLLDRMVEDPNYLQNHPMLAPEHLRQILSESAWKDPIAGEMTRARIAQESGTSSAEQIGNPKRSFTGSIKANQKN